MHASMMQKRSTIASVPRAAGPRCRPAVAVRASVRNGAADLLAAGVSIALVFAPAAFADDAAAPAAPPTPAEIVQEKEEAIAEQKAQVEYKLTQEEVARRAEIVAKKQAIERELGQVEDVIQRKLNEEAAAQLVAEKEGDEKKLAVVESEIEKIKAQEAAVQKAAAQLEARVEQEGIAEKAREVGVSQQLERATAAVKKFLGLE